MVLQLVLGSVFESLELYGLLVDIVLRTDILSPLQSTHRNLVSTLIMDMLRDISDSIGTEDFSADSCQSYLDQPATTIHDNSDVFVPNINSDVLGEIIRRIKECDIDELAGRFPHCAVWT